MFSNKGFVFAEALISILICSLMVLLVSAVTAVYSTGQEAVEMKTTEMDQAYEGALQETEICELECEEEQTDTY